jgi:ketosteroid isomerase-like protein
MTHPRRLRVPCLVALVLALAPLGLLAEPSPRFLHAGGAEVPPALRTSLAAFNHAFNRACSARDVEAMLALYAPDVEWLAPDEAPVTGLDAPRASYTRLFSGAEMSLRHEFASATVSADGSLAVMRGFYLLKLQPDSTPLRGNFCLVLVRAGETWRIVTDVFQGPIQPGEKLKP